MLHFFFSSIWFRLFDDDNSGRITFKNLKRVAKELGENLTDEELQVSGFLLTNFEVKDHLFFFRKWLMKQIAMVMMKSTNKNFYESWKKHHYIKTFVFLFFFLFYIRITFFCQVFILLCQKIIVQIFRILFFFYADVNILHSACVFINAER